MKDDNILVEFIREKETVQGDTTRISPHMDVAFFEYNALKNDYGYLI